MAITLRNTKGSALTHAELDGNFTDLDGRVLDSNEVRTLIDSDYVQLRQADIYRDSGFVTNIIDSDYIQLRQADIYRDSGFVTNIIDSAYVEARISAHYAGFDSDFGTKTTTNLTEGTNLYYTTARADSDTLALVDSAYVQARMSAHYNGFDSDFGTKTTTNLAEGTNLYYTTARHDSDFTTSLNAAILGYSTDSASLWTGTPPTTVDSALDRLALVVRTLNGGTGA